MRFSQAKILVLGCAALLASAMPASANIVLNGGFETGNLSGWTQSGNTGFTGVECPGAGLVPEGLCQAFAGPVGSDGSLSQDLFTQAGQVYSISFDFTADGLIPSNFSASFGGTGLTSVVNPPAGSNQLTFLETATGPVSTLVFNFRNDNGFLFLDDVQVNAVNTGVPEPLTLSLFGAGLAGTAVLRRRKAKSA